MANTNQQKQGGSHEQHVKAGSQSHKNQPQSAGANQRGSQQDQHSQQSKAGQQSHKNR
ncbi:hypothetical protein [Methylobacillus glycogenes]|uniref:hypothetical protein n=1 Tax=Methylobacillus glycogenes TaxID=406 RepID=UPI000A9E1B4C|nr:hypothetical protein [Methylobacillus glycogenes]MBL8505665.1 hypothetical protein [Methylobacillus glycogenes]